MARIVFLPAPSLGHVNPTFRLAKVARSRGHEVVYSSFRDVEDPILAEGFGFVPAFEDLFPKGELERSFARVSGLKGLARLKAVRRLIRREARMSEEILGGAMERQLAALKPDLLLCDVLLTHARIVAHGCGIPTRVVNTTLPAKRLPPLAAGLLPAAGRALKRGLWQGLSLLDLPSPLPLARTLNALARKHGYPRVPWTGSAFDLSHPGVGQLVLCPQEFFPLDGARSPGTYHHIGPAIDLERKEPDFPWGRLDADKPLILLSPGTSAFASSEVQTLIALCRQVAALRPEWCFVLTTGTLEPASLGELPSNLIAVRHAPQLQLLKRAAAMVTHGGFNSVKECIYFGVPMVALPQRADQPAISRLVASRGLGLTSPLAGLTAPGLLEMLDAVMSRPTVRAALRKMSACFQETNSEAFIASVLEGFLPEAQATRSRAAAG